MFVYRVTHRYYFVHSDTHEDHTVNYFSTIEKARTCVKDLLGEGAKCDNDFGFDIWVSDFRPNTEYFIDMIRVF